MLSIIRRFQQTHLRNYWPTTPWEAHRVRREHVGKILLKESLPSKKGNKEKQPVNNAERIKNSKRGLNRPSPQLDEWFSEVNSNTLPDNTCKSKATYLTRKYKTRVKRLRHKGFVKGKSKSIPSSSRDPEATYPTRKATTRSKRQRHKGFVKGKSKTISSSPWKSEVPNNASSKPDVQQDEETTLIHNQNVLEELKEGDLVQFCRGSYSHWGVYFGDGVVIHLRNEHHENQTQLSRNTVDKNSRVDEDQIGDSLETSPSVHLDKFLEVAGKSRALRNNILDKKEQPLCESVIMRNVAKALSDAEDFCKLQIMDCWSFAKWCRYGLPGSWV